MFCSYSIIAFFVLFFASVSSYSQSNDTICTGRPGQAIGPYVVGTGYLQIQSGLDFASADNSIDKTKSQISNNVVRYGLTENFELSALVNALLAAATGQLPKFIQTVRVAQYQLLKDSQASKWGKPLLLPVEK